MKLQNNMPFQNEESAEKENYNRQKKQGEVKRIPQNIDKGNLRRITLETVLEKSRGPYVELSHPPE